MIISIIPALVIFMAIVGISFVLATLVREPLAYLLLGLIAGLFIIMFTIGFSKIQTGTVVSVKDDIAIVNLLYYNVEVDTLGREILPGDTVKIEVGSSEDTTKTIVSIKELRLSKEE